MNVFLNIKLIARNWWRNKLFFLISLFSLTAVWGIERSGFFNGREKWAKGFENQRV